MQRIKNLQWHKIGIYSSLYVITFAIIGSVFVLQPKQDNSVPVLRAIIVFFATVLLTKYFVYMAVSPWYDVWRTWRYERVLKRRVANYRPKVSVMIPAWNEEVGLLDTVRSLIESTYKNTELVVVNDGSTDNSDQMMRDFVKEYELKKEEARKSNTPIIDVVYHYKQNGGKGSALNKAIELATGDILLSIDADCMVDKNAVANFVKYFADPKVMAAVGNVKIGNTRTVVGMIQYLEFLFSFYFKKADSVFNAIYIIGGAAGAFRKEIFEKFGGYNTTNITEDIELSMRIQDAGMKIVYAADALVYTEGASDVNGLKKQRLRWKRGRFQTFMDLRHMFFSLKKRHNKILTLVILPLAMFGEKQLFLEPLFLLFLYVYSFLVNDYSSFISGVIVVSSMFVVQIFFDADENNKNGWSFYLLAPVGWLLFYLSTYVEYTALVKSVWGYYTKQEIVWQKWQRKGVSDSK